MCDGVVDVFDLSDNDNDCCVFCGCVMPIIFFASVWSFYSCRCFPLPATVVRSRSPSSLPTRSPSVSFLQLLLLFLVCAPFLGFSPIVPPFGSVLAWLFPSRCVMRLSIAFCLCIVRFCAGCLGPLALSLSLPCPIILPLIVPLVLSIGSLGNGIRSLVVWYSIAFWIRRACATCSCVKRICRSLHSCSESGMPLSSYYSARCINHALVSSHVGPIVSKLCTLTFTYISTQ